MSEAPSPMCSSTFGPAFSTTIERAPSSERIKRDSSTHLASTVGTGGGPAFVRMRFVAIFLPPGGAQGKPDTTSPAGFPKRVRSISPMSRTIDGLDSPVLDSPVLDSPHAPNVKDEVEAEASDSPIDEVIAALGRHVEALKEHTAVLEDLIVTLKQARN
ncbi:hypothetical protein D6D27_07945 [Aureobasidium pullulans]|nr:hypothetical protein D6D27_07945 [Aureobasidium pullulans]